MTVQTTNTSNKTVADGLEVTFNFTFQSLQASWVRAQTTDPGETDPVQRTDITVNLNEDQEATPGGTVTFDTAPVTGATVNLYRDTPQTQLTDYTDYDAFPAESHEDALDKLTMISQEIESPGTETGGCEDFLPLAGGQMQLGADITWDNSLVIGNQTFSTLLGQPSFLWAPLDTVNDEIGFSWGAADGKILAYNADGRYSLALEGRNIPLASLLPDDLVTKANLDEAGVGSDPSFNSVSWVHQTNPGTFGNYTIEYKAASIAGTGGQAMVVTPDTSNIYQGLKLIVGTTGGTFYEMDMAGGQYWSNRQQTNGGADDPLPDSMISKRYADLTYAPLSSIPGWAVSKASGAWLSNGAAQGTQRNCSVSRNSVGNYAITLTSPLTDITNCTFTCNAFGALVGIDITFSVTSPTTIVVTTTNNDSGTAVNVDVGCTFDVKDRGLT